MELEAYSEPKTPPYSEPKTPKSCLKVSVLAEVSTNGNNISDENVPFSSLASEISRVSSGSLERVNERLQSNSKNRLLRVSESKTSMDLEPHMQAPQKHTDKEPTLHRIVRSTGFGLCIACVILLNAVQIGLETDKQGSVDWSRFELPFLFIYIVELVLRFAVDKFKIVHDAWFVFDFTVVLLSSIDALGLTAALPSGGTVVVLRVARLCKVARIVRLLRFCEELYLLVISMGGAMKTVFWMWVLLALVIYMFSILFCNELGHAYPEDEQIQLWFGTVIRTCFTLFRILTLDNWTTIGDHIWSSMPAMVFLIVFFITITTYAIVNVVVAVIVQHVIDEALDREEEAMRRLEKELIEKTSTLANLYKSADVDGDGSLTKAEFVEALNMPSIQRTLKSLDLDFTELDAIYDQIDLNGDGALNITEFVQGILQMRGNARARRLFELHCDLARHMSKSEERFDKVDEKLEMQQQGLARVEAAVERLAAKLCPHSLNDDAHSEVALSPARISSQISAERVTL